MLITKKIEIDMGHRVPMHQSKCKNLHGHRWVFEVGVDDKIITTKGAPNEGMVIDFGDLKKIMIEEIDKELDHGFMMCEKDDMSNIFRDLRVTYNQKIIFVSFIPTSENVSKYIFKKLFYRLKKVNIKLCHIKVWETPNSTAICTIKDMSSEGLF